MKKLTLFLFSLTFASCLSFAQCNFVPVITANGPLNFCIGDSVKLTSCPGTAYLWNTGATTQTIVVTVEGDYWVAVTDNIGCTATSDTVRIRYAPYWNSLACGTGHAHAIKSDGTLWAWGYNGYGNLGDGSNITRNKPVHISYLKTWKMVSGGFGHTIAIRSDGTLWGWGYNNFGQVGDGSNVTKFSPVQIGHDNDWVSVTCGDYFSLAIKSNGSLWAWGRNTNGQLGDGSTITRLYPVPVATGQLWSGVSGGAQHTIAIRADGTLWTWGSNIYGQLGDSSNIEKHSPEKIGKDNDWACASAGVNHSIAIKRNGSLWSWGYNNFGQLGDGTTNGSIIPIQVGSDTTWKTVSSGDSYTLAIKTNGSLWAWGYNYFGVFGDGTSYTINSSPVQISAQTGVFAFETGSAFSAIIKGYGYEICTTGSNTYGQLGNGSSLSRKTYGCDVPALPYLTTGIISPLVYCAGSTIYVPYSTSSNYEQGTVFTAQLSDASGNFSNPADLGSLVSITSGTITGTVPLNVVPGSGYRVRVVVKCYDYAGTDNGSDIGIGAPVATITADGPTTFCERLSVNLTASQANIYSWNSGNNTQTISVTTSGSFVVTITDIYGCTAVSHPLIVTVNPLPVVTITASGPSSFCQGGSVDLTASPSGNYLWSTLETSQSITTSSAGNYSVTVTDANGCSGNSEPVTVIIYSLPTVDLTADGPTTFCNGGNVNLTASGGSTFLWSNGSTGAGIIADPTSTTLFSVTGTDNNGCMDSESILITVNPLPDLVLVASPPAICFGMSSIIDVSGATDYIWSNGLGSGSEKTVAPALTTNYSVTGTDNNGCSNTAAVTLTVNPMPIVAISASSQFVCSGSPIELTASGASAYNWSAGLGSGNPVTVYPLLYSYYDVTGTDINGCTGTASVYITTKPVPNVTANALPSNVCSGISSNLTASGATTYSWSNGLGTGAFKTVTPLTTTTYTVSGTGTNGCVGTATVTVTVRPAVMAFADPMIICKGESSTLKATGSTTTYNWNNGLGSGQTKVVTPNSTTTYSVTGTTNNGCTNKAWVTVTVNPVPTTTLKAAPPSICEGTATTLTAGGATTYTWNDGFSGNPHIAYPTVTTTFTVTGTNTYGCSSSSSVTVTVKPAPFVVMTVNPAQICAGFSSTLTASGALSYDWSNGLGTGPTKIVTPAVTTTYTVTGTASNKCKGWTTGTVTVNPKPTVTVTANPSSITPGQTSTLTAAGASTYAWSNNLGTGNPKVVSPIITTTYSVTGTSAYGCSSTAKVTVTVTQKGADDDALSGVTDFRQINEPIFECFPNPFHDKAIIRFGLPENDDVKLVVYDLTGNLLIELYSGAIDKNKKYTVEFDASALPTGIYIYKLVTSNGVITGKMIKNIQ